MLKKHFKMSASKTNAEKDAADLKQTRRRLSVMSDNKLIEGLDNVAIGTAEEESTVSF